MKSVFLSYLTHLESNSKELRDFILQYFTSLFPLQRQRLEAATAKRYQGNRTINCSSWELAMTLPEKPSLLSSFWYTDIISEVPVVCEKAIRQLLTQPWQAAGTRSCFPGRDCTCLEQACHFNPVLADAKISIETTTNDRGQLAPVLTQDNRQAFGFVSHISVAAAKRAN